MSVKLLNKLNNLKNNLETLNLTISTLLDTDSSMKNGVPLSLSNVLFGNKEKNFGRTRTTKMLVGRFMPICRFFVKIIGTFCDNIDTSGLKIDELEKNETFKNLINLYNTLSNKLVNSSMDIILELLKSEKFVTTERGKINIGEDFKKLYDYCKKLKDADIKREREERKRKLTKKLYARIEQINLQHLKKNLENATNAESKNSFL